MMTHHLQTLVVIVGPVFWVSILGLAITPLLPHSMSTIDTHPGLSLCLEHVERRIFIPSVNEVAMETISITNLSKRHR